MLYMVTFTINIHPMLAYIPYMDPMGYYIYIYIYLYTWVNYNDLTVLPKPGIMARIRG